jgi:hypothetical protein
MNTAKIKEHENGWSYDLGWCSGVGNGSKEDAIKRAREAEPGCKLVMSAITKAEGGQK